MGANPGYVFDGEHRPDPLTGAVPIRDTFFGPRLQQPRETVAFRVRYRFTFDPEGQYRVSPLLWERDAVSLRDQLASTETVDFDQRFPDGLESVEGWVTNGQLPLDFEIPEQPKAMPPEPHVARASELADGLLTLVKHNPLALMDEIAFVNDWLAGLSCSEAEEAMAIISNTITVPLAHSGPLHADVLHG